MKRLILAALIAIVFAIPAAAQSPAPVIAGNPTTGETPGELRRRTFDIVWRTVKDKHFDPGLGGVNWDKVREQYEPRAAAAASEPELYKVLQEMLGELHQSHFNIIPPEAIVPENEKEPSGGIGIDLRVIGGEAVITRVDADSAAFRAGLRPGFIIKSAGETSVGRIVESLANSTQSASMKNVRLTRRILGEINGEPGTAVKLAYLDGKDQRRETTVTRERMKGELSPRLGNFPAQYTEFESKRVAGNIGYIRFNIFTMPVIEKLRAAIRGFHDADGIVFDLRGNPGGVGGIASSIAGELCEKPGSLGTMKMRSGEMKFAIFPQYGPRHKPYTGMVAILIDGLSGSTSEVFSSGMQELGRAVIVGERSAGACLPSYFQKLPTGALFQFAVADFKTPKGVLVEGRGVIPDTEVKWNRAALLSGRDAQLEAAIQQMRRAPQRSRAVQ